MSDKLVKSAIFKASYPGYKLMPDFGMPEFAFIGRSNVGKSSLINMLTGKKELALTSSKPGKTKQIVCFEVDQTWMLIDLPGYGYAKTSKLERAGLSELVRDYLLRREKLYCVFLLIDSRHPPQKIDLDFMEWCAENAVPFVIVFTKIDKLKPAELDQNLDFYTEELLKTWVETPQQFISSATHFDGREDLLGFIKNAVK
jgi:GTP-binding protein